MGRNSNNKCKKTKLIIGPVLIFTGYKNTYMHKAKIDINKR